MYNEHIMNEGRKGGTMEKVLLNMKAISKTFGSVQALKEVSLDLYAGEVPVSYTHLTLPTTPYV